MPLQSTGPISMKNIKDELQSSSNILRVYSEAAGFTAPHSIKEFLGYTALGAFKFTDWSGNVFVDLNGTITTTIGNAAAIQSVSPSSFELVRVSTVQTISVTIRVPSGYSNSGTNISGNKTATQPPKLFTYQNWVNNGGIVSVNANSGIVSFADGSLGTVSSVVPTSFDLVTSPTLRDIEVYVNIPSGYANTPDVTVNGTYRVSQAAIAETISITLNGSTNTWNPSGQGGDTSLAVDVVNLWNTSWTVQLSDSSWLSVSTPTGTGDGTRTISARANYEGQPAYTGEGRSGYVTVYKTSDFGIRANVNVFQPVGVAPAVAPTVALTPPNNAQIGYNEFGDQNNYKLYSGTWTGGTTPTQGSFVMMSTAFAFVSTDPNVIITQEPGDRWVGTITNPTASPYSVGVYALSANSSTTNEKTATITFRLANTAGFNSTSATVSQAVAQPIFTFPDAGANGFAVSQNGTITAPTLVAGTINSITYTNSNFNTSYPIVGTNTTRYARIYLTVPPGFSNSGVEINGEVSTIQPLTESFVFTQWSGYVVSINQDGQVFASAGNAAAVVSLSPANFDKVYTPTLRDVFVTIRVPSGYFNSGNTVNGYIQVEQPAAPEDPIVTVYTRCDTNSSYFVEGQYSYQKILLLGSYCAYRAEQTTKSVALASSYTEFFSVTESTDCEC